MGKRREQEGRADRHRLRENAESSSVLQPRAGLTFPPALELHPDGLVDVLGEVQDTLLLLLLLILRQSIGSPVKTRHPRRRGPRSLPRDPTAAGQGRGYTAGTAAGPAPLLTAIFPAPPPPPPLAISFGTARSDVAPRRSPLAARGAEAGRPGRALGARCGRVRPGPGRNKAAAARQARHGGAAGPAPSLAAPASAAAGQWLCRAVCSPSHARAAGWGRGAAPGASGPGRAVRRVRARSRRPWALRGAAAAPQRAGAEPWPQEGSGAHGSAGPALRDLVVLINLCVWASLKLFYSFRIN